MTHDVIRHFLDDYVTGELAEDARAPVAEHIAGCEICSAEVEGLQRILARAAELPKAVEPPPTAWVNIRAAIQRDENALSAPRSIYNRWRPFFAAAAVLMVAVLSSGATYLYLRADDGSEAGLGRPATAAEVREASERPTPTNLAAFTLEENDYLRSARMLQEVLDSQEDALAPETVAQLRASLRTIDEAILEARNALARDPANKMLVEMLSATYRHKLDLLRRTTEMTRDS